MLALNRIALIEIGGSHSECLYSQLEFTKNPDTEITLICSSNLKEAVKDFKQVTHFYFIDYNLGEWNGAFKVRKILNRQHFDAVIINTAHGKRVRNVLAIPFLKKQNFTGIAHNTKKILNSNTQRIINRKVKKYFVLAEYLLENLNSIQGIKLGYFYSMLYPKRDIKFLEKEKDTVWICIPGQVEYKRRDYKTLFEQIGETGLQANINLIFLGKSKHEHGDGDAIEKEIERLGIKDQCILWDGFVETNTFEAYMQQCDYLLPLIHRDKPELNNYFTNQISGTFNLAFGYKKLLLLEESFKDYPDFKEDATFYEKTELVELLNGLKPETKNKLYQSSRFSFEARKRRYLEFVMS